MDEFERLKKNIQEDESLFSKEISKESPSDILAEFHTKTTFFPKYSLNIFPLFFVRLHTFIKRWLYISFFPSYKFFRKFSIWIIPIISLLIIGIIDNFIDLYLLFPKDQTFSNFWDIERNIALEVLGSLNRSMNQILMASMVCLVIALPLSATLYTPKLVSRLIKEPIISATLAIIILNNGNTIWVMNSFHYMYVPVFQFYFCFLLFIFCIILLFPYFAKIVNHLDPYSIFIEIEKSLTNIFHSMKDKEHVISNERDKIIENIAIINNIILKATERSDRELSFEGVQTQKRILFSYASMKKQLPKNWLEANLFQFMGMSAEGLEEINHRKIWFELYILRFLSDLFTRSLNRLPELSSGIAETIYQLGVKFMNSNEPYMLELCTRIFNTFLSNAINKKDPTAIQNIFYQYRLFAEMTLTYHSKTICEIGRFFKYYSHLAAQANILQIRDTALYDLVYLVYIAKIYANDELAYEALCQSIMEFDADAYLEERNQILKAKIIFAAFIIKIKDEKILNKIWPELTRINQVELEIFYKDLMLFNERIQAEITDRFTSSAYLKEEQASDVEEVFKRLGFSSF